MKTISKKTASKKSQIELRPFQMSDYFSWSEIYRNMRPAQSPWDENPWQERYLTKAEFKKILVQHKKLAKSDKCYFYGVFDKRSQALLGYVALNDISRGIFNNAYIGYRIFNLYWGQGLASEAVAQALKIGFKKIKLHRIEAGIHKTNKASIKVAKKNGMRFEGSSLRRLFVNGKWTDLEIFAITSEEF